MPEGVAVAAAANSKTVCQIYAWGFYWNMHAVTMGRRGTEVSLSIAKRSCKSLSIQSVVEHCKG